jgi:signal transduction histidine kinase
MSYGSKMRKLKPFICSKNGIITEVNDKFNILTRYSRKEVMGKSLEEMSSMLKLDSGYMKLNLSNENIVSIVEDVVQSVVEYVQGKGLRIIFDTNTEEKIIACDTNKIERILLNLISNAIKYSDTGKEIFVNVLDKDETVEISVEDKGIGIDSKYLDSIFDRFRQVDNSLSRKAEGSGIGLCIVKSLVELHGGKISVESNEGKGSIFRISLPSRTVDKSEVAPKNQLKNNKVEMINIKFSDLYSINT